ncbi:ECF transporter S component [Mycoplasma sp. 'Moose RK']|nr:ECF transporter S component [Mycoplasma sp. 'Moose RK']
MVFKKIVPNFREKIAIFLEKNRRIFYFSNFDLTISGLLMAMFLVITYIAKITIPTRFNLAFELPFYILLGIILHWFKGMIVAFSFDFGKLLLTSRIIFWTPEYAIVPIFITFLAAVFFNLAKKNDKFLLIPMGLFFLSSGSVFLYYFFLEEIEIQKVPKVWGDLFNKKTVLILIGVFIISVWTLAIILFVFYRKKRTKKLKIALISLITLAVCYLIARWLWHPFAFIQYYNRFLNRTGKDRLIQEYFYYYLTPIILKSTVSFPIYSFVVIELVPLFLYLNKKHNYRWRFGY